MRNVPYFLLVNGIDCWGKRRWTHLAVVLDLYSRQVVGWAIDPSPSSKLAVRALENAVKVRRPKRGLIFHTDRGAQYACEEFQSALKRHNMNTSMSRAGEPYDNAVVESFFHTLKMEHVYWQKYETRGEAKRKIFEYIEVFYNRKRLHSFLGYKSPVEFESKNMIA